VIYGIGTDILEVERMSTMIAKGGQYLETIFTKNERDYSGGKSRQAVHYAVRFAAKEAVLKALGTGWRDGLAFSDIEILNDELGKPQVFLHGKVRTLFEQLRIKQISISLSHTQKIALAVVILEK